MGAPDVLARLSALGVRLTREGEAIRAAPRSALTDEARALIRAHKAELLEVLREPRGDQFEFAPPEDPANDAEALEERAAIIAKGCGMDQTQALQEARWHVHREQCWRVFLRNAQRVLVAPAHEREGLLARYQAEAMRRYGKRTGTDMAGSLRAWVKARAVH